MKRIVIADTPSGAENYQLEDGRIIRVHLKLLTPSERLADADQLDVETQGFEITKSGAFVVDDKTGIPVMFPVQRARIPMSHVRAGSDSVKPGWITQALPEEKAAKAAELAKHKQASGKSLPKSGEPGDTVVHERKLYAWTNGLYDAVRTGRLAELSAAVAPAPKLDAKAVADLQP